MLANGSTAMDFARATEPTPTDAGPEACARGAFGALNVLEAGSPRRFTASTSVGRMVGTPEALASSQCEALRKYSSAGGIDARSIRNVNTGRRFDVARSISL